MKNFSDSDIDDEISDRRAPRPPARTFQKTNDPASLRLDLGHSQRDDDDDSLDTTDEESTTARSTSSHLTPKPKERKSFMKTTTKIDENDDVFGRFNATIKPSPKHRPTTLREDEENDQSFARQFKKETPRRSPTDMFSSRRSSHEAEDISEHERSRKSSRSHHDDEEAAREVLTRQNFMRSKPASEEAEAPPHPAPPAPTSAPASRPASAKSVTNRQQTQAALNDVSTANQSTFERPPDIILQPMSSLPPKPSAAKPPTRQKAKFRVPNQYKEITSRIDSGRTPAEQVDLRQSIDRAMKKALQKNSTATRPQSARTVDRSASRERRRRRLSSAYEHVQPKINTNRSINFDELNTSAMHAESSQSIKDAVYLEWAKTKEDEKKKEKQRLKEWKETREKSLDKTSIEREALREAQRLEHWRREKEEEAKRKRLEQLKVKREAEEAKRQEESRKKNDAKAGFTEWEAAKRERIDRQREEEEQKKKAELERQQEEKQKKFLESQKKCQEWKEKKAKITVKSEEEKKKMREEQVKQVHQEKETRFVSAQKAYDDWLKLKDDNEEQEKVSRSRRNSLTNAPKALPPFLPGGSQKNTGRVRHVVW